MEGQNDIILSIILIAIVMATCFLLRKASNHISHHNTRNILLHALAAGELCAIAYEFNPALLLQSPAGLLLFFMAWNVILCWFAKTGGKITCNPINELETMFHGIDSLGKAIITITAEIAGGILGTRYMQLLYNIMGAEKIYKCASSFSEPLLTSMAVEAVGTFLIKIIAYVHPTNNRLFPTIVNNCLMICTAIAGMQFSCGTYNPMVATVTLLLCKHVPINVFIPVFWGGPFLGFGTFILAKPQLDNL